jgi:hypothetical protein
VSTHQGSPPPHSCSHSICCQTWAPGVRACIARACGRSTHWSVPTSLPDLASPMYCISRHHCFRPTRRMLRMVRAKETMVKRVSENLFPSSRSGKGEYVRHAVTSSAQAPISQRSIITVLVEVGQLVSTQKSGKRKSVVPLREARKGVAEAQVKIGRCSRSKQSRTSREDTLASYALKSSHHAHEICQTGSHR